MSGEAQRVNVGPATLCPIDIALGMIDSMSTMSRLVADEVSASDPVLTTLTRSVSDFLQANADFLQQVTQLTLRFDVNPRWPAPRAAAGYHRRPQTAASVGRVILAGDVGQAVEGAFLIQNRLCEPATVTVIVSKFVGADGVPIDIDVDFQPNRIHLEPAQEVIVRVRAVLPDSLAPGQELCGTILAPGLENTAVPIALRRVQPAA